MNTTLRVLGAALLASLSLSGCGIFKKPEPPPDCPPLRIDKATADVIQFRPGPGRDVTDIVLEGSIASIRGECKAARDNMLDVLMRVDFAAARGPANREGKGSLTYFVAIPVFHPAPGGKQVFTTEVEFPGNQTRVRYRDEEISLRIPRTSPRPDQPIEIYVGFQLTAEQLQYNRRAAAVP